jgi:hypothetical protein
MHYIATARAYCFDLTTTALLFVSVSLMAGRVWRFPFDDEIATLSKIEPDAARQFIATFPATDDIHPPLLYLIFYGLRQLGRRGHAALQFVHDLGGACTVSDPGSELASLPRERPENFQHPPASLPFSYSV